MKRLALAALLLVNVGLAQRADVFESAPTAKDLASLLGVVKVFNVLPPVGAKGYAVVISGGPSASGPDRHAGQSDASTWRAALTNGRLRILVGFVNLGCDKGQVNARLELAGSAWASCLKLPSGTSGSTVSTFGSPAPRVVLKRWTRLVTFTAVSDSGSGSEHDKNVITVDVIFTSTVRPDLEKLPPVPPKTHTP
ncbi:hypothetical protein [Deinococcus yavapaiensis]|uniref:Uncharacterized protein n=1 Tax=Deinococcus yavapaiensis KR-236 TaxID=694435 RepID=A0A318SAM2_9DEIO|nr:hypothetical protein [Deinococcus yavapaiensis]PYE56460.1 hypothetical protein DES52_101264 [Deinococcus yavapaiensis KR-236]